MKLMISFLLLILSLNFCSNQIEPENLDLKLTYFVTDSLGNEKYSFTQNEEFQVKFEIKNNSDKELTFDIVCLSFHFQLKRMVKQFVIQLIT